MLNSSLFPLNFKPLAFGLRPLRSGGRLLAIMAVALSLTGCYSASVTRMNERDILDTGPSNGRYKIGSPYQIQGVWYYPSEDWNYQEKGVASWYGPGFHRKKTANGETYDQSKLSAAHRTLPMPCFVRVTNMDNGRSIVVRVNDRGPFARDRIVDVSMRGAQLLGYERLGTANVRLEILTDESKRLAREMLQRQRADAVRDNHAEDIARLDEQLAALAEGEDIKDNGKIETAEAELSPWDGHDADISPSVTSPAPPPHYAPSPNAKLAARDEGGDINHNAAAVAGGRDDAPPPLLVPYANHRTILSQALAKP